MSLLAPDDQERLRNEFAVLSRKVHLLFFTQTLGCESCGPTRQILDELPSLSDRVVVDEINLILERDRAAAYGIDRAPAVVFAVEHDDKPGELVDTRIRFLGTPSGYEFISLVQAVLIAGGGPPVLSDSSRQQLAAVQKPVAIQVFSTPT